MVLRNTKQRELILSVVNNSCEHLTTEEIYLLCKDKINNISLGTVYRNLNTLVIGRKSEQERHYFMQNRIYYKPLITLISF